MNARDQGLFHKFDVRRTDGRDARGEKHHGCDYFVLDLTHDAHAFPAIGAYADSCAADYPALAADLRRKIAEREAERSAFVTVPETTLPNGLVVPSFRCSTYLSSRGCSGIPISVPDAKPWVDISYHEARATCENAGYKLLTETQALAIAWNIAQQDINWTDGKVGEGLIYQGLHRGTVKEAQAGTFESKLAIERRWHELSNGERLFDFAGNAFTWVFDDVQGDDNGLVAKAFAADSPSLSAPHPSCEKGTGWRPDAGAKWSGNALIRGGCWCSGSKAGVFRLGYGWPDVALDFVGFRCTR